MASPGHLLDCDCPRCGSTRTRSLNVIYETGTRDTLYRTRGWIWYRGRFGLSGSTTTSRSQSVAAQSAAPRQAITTALLQSGVVTWILIGSVLFWGGPGLVVAAACLLVFAVVSGLCCGNSKDDSDIANLFRCNRCGATFEPKHAAPLSRATW